MRGLARARHAAALLAVAFWLVPRLGLAGAYIFADEANGPGVITHPLGYEATRFSPESLVVTVCIDPAAPDAAAMEVPVRNAIYTLNRLEAVSRNLYAGNSNNIAASQVDFESSVIHELGHCVDGLGHPNLPGGGWQGLFTTSTDGEDDGFFLDEGPDTTPGSPDDARGDDVNMNWFRTADNNPFALGPVVDSTTYSRVLGDLPAGHTYSANGGRKVGALLGFPGVEAVMMQGSELDEDQRRLSTDDVAAILYGRTGLDERTGTTPLERDDYTVTASYAGITTSCDIVLAFDSAQTSFAACYANGVFMNGTHVAITSGEVFFNEEFSWFYNPILAEDCGNGVVDAPEECDDANSSNTDACSISCLDAFCGDGFVRVGVEACDDGNFADDDACPTSCQDAFCGDGFTHAGVEECDDANGLDSDTCTTTCTAAFCGDGILWGGVEECDDANGTAGDGCSASCFRETIVLLGGTAVGGSVSLLIQSELITVATTNRETSEAVATALAAEINANPVLQSLGIDAVAIGSTVETAGVRGSTTTDDGVAIGFDPPLAAPVPALAVWGAISLALALGVGALLVFGRPSLFGSTRG